MVQDDAIQRFAELYNRRVELQRLAEGRGGSEQDIRDHIIARMGYREAFEVLTSDDPSARKRLTALISEEWAVDRAGS